jgi:hypothetical protein
MARGRLAWGFGKAKRAAEASYASEDAPVAPPPLMLDHYPLARHPDSAPGCIESVAISIARPELNRLLLIYSIKGDIGALQLPAPVKPSRADHLWETTCGEAFLRLPERAGYTELNFAPSTRWAAYRFSGYRDGMRPIAAGEPPQILFAGSDDQAELRAEIDLTVLGADLAGQPLHLAIAAVTETRRKGLAYWALAHPPGKPDFHHRDCFALQLAPPPPA